MSVIIVGGGMTGATLALAISHMTQGQLPVHLVEAVAPEASNHPGFDARAIALAQGTCRQLARIGIWPVRSSRVPSVSHRALKEWRVPSRRTWGDERTTSWASSTERART